MRFALVQHRSRIGTFLLTVSLLLGVVMSLTPALTLAEAKRVPLGGDDHQKTCRKWQNLYDEMASAADREPDKVLEGVIRQEMKKVKFQWGYHRCQGRFGDIAMEFLPMPDLATSNEGLIVPDQKAILGEGPIDPTEGLADKATAPTEQELTDMPAIVIDKAPITPVVESGQEAVAPTDQIMLGIEAVVATDSSESETASGPATSAAPVTEDAEMPVSATKGQ